MSVENPDQPWWHRKGDTNKRVFLMGNDVRVERFYEDQDKVLAELKEILRRELSHVRDWHLVRLKVEVQLCH